MLQNILPQTRATLPCEILMLENWLKFTNQRNLSHGYFCTKMKFLTNILNSPSQCCSYYNIRITFDDQNVHLSPAHKLQVHRAACYSHSPRSTTTMQGRF